MSHTVDRRDFLIQASVWSSTLGLAACGGGGGGTSTSTPIVNPTPDPVVPDIPIVPSEINILVPAYSYKARVWEKLADTTTPLVVIANASNGPGSRWDAQYQEWIDRVRDAGHRVKGYVYTGYGKRNSASVLADIETWNTLYGINDFFLDEASIAASDLTYYRTILNQAVAVDHSRRFMLNPGTPPDKGYFTLLSESDIEILVYEKPWYNYTSNSLPTWLNTFASQCWIMALVANETDMQAAAQVTRTRNFAGFFATDTEFSVNLPSYWESEAEMAARMNGVLTI